MARLLLVTDLKRLPLLALVPLLASCGAPSSETGSQAAGEPTGPMEMVPGSPTTSATGMPTAPPAMPTSVIPEVPIDAAKSPALGPIALRRLSTTEYENTVQDLLKVPPGTTAKFPNNETSLGYKNIASALFVPTILAERYGVTARKLASGLDVSSAAPCAVGTPELECATAFIQSFGRQAFRRPVTSEEITGYSQIFQGEVARTDYAGGIRLVVEAMLQSPHFLYKTEIGEGSGLDRKLTPHELASQISYLATGSMPDPELGALADAGMLDDPTVREAQVRRLMGTSRGVEWLSSFVAHWLGMADADQLGKNLGFYPSYNTNVALAVDEESARFVGSVLTEHNGSLQTLFTANWTIANSDLAVHYGLPPLPSPGWQKVELPASERLGVLTHAAFAVVNSKASDSFPIRRGKTLRTRVLCGDVPPPPPDLGVTEVNLSDDITTRERFEEHQKSGSVCAGCHALMDPLGFGFENYDPVGAYRTEENGQPIDPSGAILSVSPEVDGPFANGMEFSQRVASSEVLKYCAAREIFRWGVGRVTKAEPLTDPGVVRDLTFVQTLSARLAANTNDIRELLVALVTREEYAFRSDK